MIERYCRSQMKELWLDRNRYAQWLRIELAVCEEMFKDGVISKKDWAELKQKCEKLEKSGGLDPAAIEAEEKTTRHDILAFTTVLAREIGPVSRFVHFGLTSSDVVDSALALQVSQSGVLILEDIDQLLATLDKRAQQYKKLPTIARSHGIFAEPTCFGLKFLGWAQEWKRNRERVKRALDGMKFGKLSGAVGVNSHWSPEKETQILGRLGLQREPIATQVIPRDRHAELLSAFAICGASIERIAIEIRHLQRSEVAEVMEGFKKGQKGSSAMPHKRNPISSENLTGCARLLRSFSQAALENVALWHERDISHSSVERVIFPDAFQLLDYALDRMNQVMMELEVFEPSVMSNLARAGKISFSGHFLLELVREGVNREDAYQWIQQCALKALEDEKRGKGSEENFEKHILEHAEIKKTLSAKKVKELGSLDYQLRHVPQIFEICKRIR